MPVTITNRILRTGTTLTRMYQLIGKEELGQMQRVFNNVDGKDAIDGNKVTSISEREKEDLIAPELQR